ncbi:MAG: L-threonylcarbamoyladenylate synthase [Chitinophagaceae bacterium]
MEQDLQKCIEVLRNGGIILYPTDTIWGIGCDATNAQAVKKIYQLKQRDESKSMIVLLADERDLYTYIAAPDPAIFDCLEQQTKPTTYILDHALGLAENLIHTDGSVGIRIVNDEFCKHLIKRLGKPIVSTSANISGSPSPRFFDEIDPAIISGVDYCVQYRRDDRQPRQPSSIIRVNQDGTTTVLRP